MPFDESFLRREINRFPHDFVIYAPAADDEHNDHGNEHLHVFRAKDGNLCALWTMSKFEGTFTQRPVFSKSRNGGLTWSDPVCLLRDPINAENGKNMGSWATVAISKSGKMYVIYAKHLGNTWTHESGVLTVIASDDAGESWSEEAQFLLPVSKYDLGTDDQPPRGFPWQRANRLANGTVLLAYSHYWIAPWVPKSPNNVWVEHPCSCELIRFDNIDDDPDPADLKLSFLAQGDHTITAPLRDYPDQFCSEEPAICELPDGRLFMVMRTAEGHVWYTVSEDSGETWRKTEMLRYYDDGPGVEHPLSPCPMFRISDNEFVLFTHNNDGFFGEKAPQVTGNWRNPLFILKGEFRKDAHQPVWFSQPVEFMNNENAELARKDLAMYCDMTIEEDGTPILWFPDRKFFLLGRKLSRELLDSMTVPEKV